jgi:transposase-like protein
MTYANGRGRKGPTDGTVDALPAACTNEAEAVALMESLRWGNAPTCPRCVSPEVRRMMGSDGKRNARFLWRCLGECKSQFTVRIGTVMEESRIAMRHWCYAFWRATTSKKGVSALELHRQTGVSHKSCLFMLARIRKAFATDWQSPPRMTGTVEADEVYIGGKPRNRVRLKRGPLGRPDIYARKTPVVAFLQREGDVRAFPVKRVDAKTIGLLFDRHVDTEQARLNTDSAKVYIGPGRRFRHGHEAVSHEQNEYARGDVTTNRVEGFFSIIRRGLHGIYHSVSPEHLHRYIAEFEWRYNHRKMTDGDRVRAAVVDSQGKRLMRRAPRSQSA